VREGNQQAAAGRQVLELLIDALRMVFKDRLTAVRAMRNGQSGIEQFQVIVDVSDGADRRP